MHDYLLERSWVYQELVKEGELKGIETGRVQGFENGRAQGFESGVETGRAQGFESGVETGRAQGFRQSIQDVVQTRFPALTDLATERIEHVQNLDMLQKIHIAMIAAPTERKARHYLLALNVDK